MEGKFDDLKFGDIICVKSFSFLGWAIGKSFHVDSIMIWHLGSKEQRRRPSNHNGIVGYGTNGELVIYEALGKGIVVTPIQEYVDSVKAGQQEIKFVRTKLEWNEKAIEFGQAWLLKKVGTKYDFLSYVSHIWRSVFNLPDIRAIHSDDRFYCTEFVMRFYQYIKPWAGSQKTDFFEKTLPTPYTVEKRYSEGLLSIVREEF